MKTIKYLLLIAIIYFVTFSCKQEPETFLEKTYVHCRDNMTFNCTSEPLGDNYFKGKLNGTDFCVSAAVDGYRAFHSIGTEATTSASNLVLSPNTSPISTFYSFYIIPPQFDPIASLSEDFLPFIFIRTPSIPDSTRYSSIYYLDNFIKEGNINLQSLEVDKFDGWYFAISWGCVLFPGYNHFKEKNEAEIPVVGESLVPFFDEQEDSTFKISQLNIERDGNLVTYDFIFEIECNLNYNSGHPFNPNGKFGKLEDGVFKVKFTIED